MLTNFGLVHQIVLHHTTGTYQGLGWIEIELSIWKIQYAALISRSTEHDGEINHRRNTLVDIKRP